MEEMEIEGKKYLSSKKAAQVTGYAKDYVGQLCREGRVTAKLIGRSWYVLETSILEHRFGKQIEEDKSAIQGENAHVMDTEVSEKANIEAVFDDVEPVREPVITLNTREKDRNIESAQVHDAKVSEKANIEAIWEPPTYTPEVIEETVPVILSKETIDTKDDHVMKMQEAWSDWFKQLPEKDNRVHKAETRNPEKEEEAEEVATIKLHKVYEEPRIQTYQSPPTLEDIRPVESRIEPVRDTIREDVPLRKTEKQAKVSEERDTTNGYLGVKALAVAIVILFVSLTLINFRVVTPLNSYTASPLPILEVLSGETRL